MRFTRSRAAAVGAVLLMLTVTACAPPGQEGQPGVAATYEGTTITDAQVNDIYQAWLNDTQGKDVANRRQILTIALLGPSFLAKSKEQGYPITKAVAKSYADQWLKLKGVGGEASDEMVEATQEILALYVLVSVDPTLDMVKQISDSVAASAVVSPRSGAYSTDALLSSIQTALTSAQSQQLGTQFSFTEFQNVSAFGDQDRSWFDRGGAPS